MDIITINGRSAKDEALDILDDMRAHFKTHKCVTDIIDIQRNKIINNERYCVKVYETLSRDFQGEMLDIAKNAFTVA